MAEWQIILISRDRYLRKKKETTHSNISVKVNYRNDNLKREQRRVLVEVREIDLCVVFVSGTIYYFGKEYAATFLSQDCYIYLAYNVRPPRFLIHSSRKSEILFLHRKAMASRPLYRIKYIIAGEHSDK